MMRSVQNVATAVKIAALLVVLLLLSTSLLLLYQPGPGPSAASKIRVSTASAAAPEAPLADKINATLNDVKNWSGIVDIGVVMHRSSLKDFDTWITDAANARDWKTVFAVKRFADQAGYSSSVIDSKVKLALSNTPMFSTKYSLPITDTTGQGYFWPWDRYVLYGYGYAEQLNWDTGKWNVTSGFLALKYSRDKYGKAFDQTNPTIPYSTDMWGTRWHQAGSLADSFLIFYTFGEKNALNYSVQEWTWLNDKLWQKDHFNYAVKWPGWEFSSIDVFPNIAKLNDVTPLGNFSRISTDLQARYLSEQWSSPQWNRNYKVAEHYHITVPQRRLDGTLDAWIQLDTFYGQFTPVNQAKMHNMLEGSSVTPAWTGLLASDLRKPGTDRFRETSSTTYSDSGTAEAALTLFLMGISPQQGAGLAIPLSSDRHSDYSALDYRNFEFDYVNHRIKIPVWGDSTIKFLYGKTPVTEYFPDTGIYSIIFTSDWNSITQITKISNLYTNEYYLHINSNKTSGTPSIIGVTSLGNAAHTSNTPSAPANNVEFSQAKQPNLDDTTNAVIDLSAIYYDGQIKIRTT